MKLNKIIGLATSVAIASIISLPAAAQAPYPSKPVRVVVPFPPGGTNDIVARIVAREMSPVMGQQFVIDNRGGASGLIGAENVAKSPPDGYTLMVHSTTHITNALAYSKVPYDTFNDFEPVALLSSQPYALVIHPSLPVKSTKEFIAFAKARPNKLAYASNGEGGTPRILMALFNSMAKIDLIHVPYKGGGPMATSLLSGETQAAVATVGSVLGQIKSGRLRALGVTSAKRSAILPDVPTIAESGLPGYDMATWIGAFAPAKTPKPIVERLHSEFEKVLKKSELTKIMADQGLEPWPATQQEFVARMKTDHAAYQKVFAIIGLQPQ